MRFKSLAAATGAAFAAVLTLSAVDAAEISGAGATFPDPIYAKWSEAYRRETGTGLAYQAIGSAGGIKQIVAKTVTFGASDKPLDQTELDANGLIQFPMIMGGIIPVINVEGIKPGDIVLDGPTLAKIFLGEITQWDDPAIKALNEKVALPALEITVVHRSDGSGTTYNFTNYLAKASPEWKSKIGFEAAIEWPVGVGAKRNDGVAKSVARTEGAIGYVEYAAAAEHKLTYAAMINKEGKTVAPAMASFQAAAANADWKSVPGFGLMLTDQPGEGSWPITAASFILMQTVAQDAAASSEALKFFDWAYRKGDALAEALDYVPMPDNVVGLVQEEWAKIKDPAGKPIFATN
jgi:phosphate transport system substrate-binding protein